jgi:predicted AAA+ superfamily ATPase
MNKIEKILLDVSISVKIEHMIGRILRNRIEKHPKSILLLGPRQVGKSTLCNSLQPDLMVNLADEELFRQHLNDPGLIKRIIGGLPQGPKTILVDEIQRIPSMLNTIQALIDTNSQLRFLLTGSSARKLKRGNANLLPGRVLLEHLPPLLYWELKGQFDLNKAMTIGTLPEVYLQEWGRDILLSYVAGYLREEIQAEALTKDLASYSRFLNLAAELSGQYMNYAKVASDSEINKETIRRYMEILSDTLLIEVIPSFKSVDKKRRARQKDKFIFFDLGVRNALLGRTQKSGFSKEEWGQLFEQWLVLQVLYYDRLHKKNWRVSTYRDAMGVEVDLIIETSTNALAIEIKSSTKAHSRMFKGVNKLKELTGCPFQNYVVYQGEHTQNFEDLGCAVPYQTFLDNILPSLA